MQHGEQTEQFFFSNPLNDAADQSEGCSLDLHKYLMRKQHHTGGTSGPLQRSRPIDGSKKKKNGFEFTPSAHRK